MAAKTTARARLEAAASVKLALAGMGALMVLVLACTLAQVPLGTERAVRVFMRSWLLWWRPEGWAFSLPVFPGGGAVGALLLANLLARLWLLERSLRKAGIWLAHAGVALLFAGEFATSALQEESQIAFEEGQTRGYSESARESELAAVDATDPAFDEIWSAPEGHFRRRGGLSDPGLPFRLVLRGYHENAALAPRGPADPPSGATAGPGASLALRPLPRASADDEADAPAALVEPLFPDGSSAGIFLLSPSLGAPQGFSRDGRSWRLLLRPRRRPLPFSLTLVDFSHDRYPGTDIPKNFSSLVRIKEPGGEPEREVLISMNSPLRRGGRAFYQSSFGKDDTLSVLQVVRNPGWTVPYAACALAGLGLFWHFGLVLRRHLREGA